MLEPHRTGEPIVPGEPVGAVVFADTPAPADHGLTSEFIAQRLPGAGLAVLVVEEADLARTVAAVDRLRDQLPTAGLPLGTIGIHAGAELAIEAAAARPEEVSAVVACDPPTSALGEERSELQAATLLIVGGEDSPAAAGFARPARHHEVEVIAGTDALAGPESLELVVELTIGWFLRHLASGMPAATETAGG